MKVYAILNNYQIGSYAHRVLNQLIVEETRIDPHHTKVVWDVNQSELNILKLAVGQHKIKEDN